MKNQLEIRNKKITILGAARSGIGAALLLSKYKNKILLSDNSKDSMSKTRVNQLQKKNITVELGKHSIKKILKSDLVVLSPGISHKIDLVQKILKQGIEVISELEVGYRFFDKPIIAVTGTNGKTTVTALTGKILNDNSTLKSRYNHRQAYLKGNKSFNCESEGLSDCSRPYAGNIKTLVAGNIGQSFCESIYKNNNYDYALIEVSSFQLDMIKYFRPYISVITNLTPDHLDRYDSIEEYYLSKMNIFKNQTAEDYAVLNFKDKQLLKLTKNILSKKIYFNYKKSIYLNEKKIISNDNKISLPLKNIKIFGNHNYENVMTSIQIARLLNISEKKIIKVIKNFDGVEHRIEFVGKKNTVKFYNDSKATNIESLIKSIESFKNNIILIAGGRDKNQNFKRIKNFIKKKVSLLILIGESADKISDQLNLNEITVKCGSLKNAVATAFLKAKKNTNILLSPGCASFDMFKNFEDRGKKFKLIVHKLINEV